MKLLSNVFHRPAAPVSRPEPTSTGQQLHESLQVVNDVLLDAWAATLAHESSDGMFCVQAREALGLAAEAVQALTDLHKANLAAGGGRR